MSFFFGRAWVVVGSMEVKGAQGLRPLMCLFVHFAFSFGRLFMILFLSSGNRIVLYALISLWRAAKGSWWIASGAGEVERSDE